VDEKIIGTTMPVLELTLNPGEAIFAESGELSWMTSSIQMTTSTQYGGGGGIGGVFKRAVGGGSLFMTEYAAQGAPGMVAFAAKLPGQIFPLDVRPEPGMQFLATRSWPAPMACSSPSGSSRSSAPAPSVATVSGCRRSVGRAACGAS
jgi:biogenesis AIM24-like protein